MPESADGLPIKIRLPDFMSIFLSEMRPDMSRIEPPNDLPAERQFDPPDPRNSTPRHGLQYLLDSSKAAHRGHELIKDRVLRHTPNLSSAKSTNI
jgi:hypothetical protein